MEINFETLKRCNNCRFKAKRADEPVHGIIYVRNPDEIVFFYTPEDETMDWFQFFSCRGHRYVTYAGEAKFEFYFPLEFSDFKVIPRDPETYMDWQVGDHVAMPASDNDNDNKVIIIFRAGELVVFKRPMGDGRWEADIPYTCEELFEKGYRLVLTDIEKQMIKEKKAAENVSRFYALKRLAPVLVRDRNASTWKAAVFDRVEPEQDHPFLMLSETRWKQCAPLNEETVGYLGTTEKIPNQCGKE